MDLINDIEFYLVENYYGFRLIANDNIEKKTLVYLDIRNKNKKFSEYTLSRLLRGSEKRELGYVRPEFMNPKIRTWKIKRR